MKTRFKDVGLKTRFKDVGLKIRLKDAGQKVSIDKFLWILILTAILLIFCTKFSITCTYAGIIFVQSKEFGFLLFLTSNGN